MLVNMHTNRRQIVAKVTLAIRYGVLVIIQGHTQNRSWTRERLPARTDRWTEPSAVTCRSEILDNYATSTLTPNIGELRRARYWQVTHRTGPGHVRGCQPGQAGGLGLVP
ncbi:hypothetical protein J6590_006343 [Homalodisca vitripennis]|nr:hypothetical protein J6590_006343 [Homalodisca vitripennis]